MPENNVLLSPKGTDLNTVRLVPLINTPNSIVKDWTEAYKESIESKGIELGKLAMIIENRQVEYVKEPVAITHMALDKEENIWVGIEGENDVAILALTAGYRDDTKTTLKYYPIYETPTDERTYSNVNTIQHMEQPTAGVGAVIRCIEDGRVKFLLARRVKGPQAYINKLSNFGGKIELGESMTEALAREIYEETGIVWEQTETNIVTDHTIFKYKDGLVYDALSFSYLIDIPETAEAFNKEPGKCRDFGWYDLDYITENRNELTDLALDAFIAFGILDQL